MQQFCILTAGKNHCIVTQIVTHLGNALGMRGKVFSTAQYLSCSAVLSRTATAGVQHPFCFTVHEAGANFGVDCLIGTFWGEVRTLERGVNLE